MSAFFFAASFNNLNAPSKSRCFELGHSIRYLPAFCWTADAAAPGDGAMSLCENRLRNRAYRPGGTNRKQSGPAITKEMIAVRLIMGVPLSTKKQVTCIRVTSADCID